MKPSLRPNLFEISSDPFFTNEEQIQLSDQNNIPKSLRCHSELMINTDKINMSMNNIGKYDSSRKPEQFKKNEVNPFVLKLLND